MFWAGTCGDTLIVPFIVEEEEVEMDSEEYAYFLKQHFFKLVQKSTPLLQEEMHLYAW